MKTVIKKLRLIKHHRLVFLIIIFVFPGLVANDNSNVQDPLSPREREWLTKHNGKIRLTNAPIWPPLASIDENNVFIGISPDYMGLIEKKLNFKFKTVQHKTWKEMLQDALDKKVDVVGAIQKTPNRSEYLIYTKIFIKTPNVIVARKKVKGPLTLENMKGMRVAVGDGFAAEEYIRKNYTNLNIMTVPDDFSLLKKVLEKEADAMISDLLTVSYFVEKHGINDVRIAGEIHYDLELRMSIRNDWPILKRILEKGLDLITQEEKEAIEKKWIKNR